jgi:hypothetical protein
MQVLKMHDHLETHLCLAGPNKNIPQLASGPQ